MLQEATSRGWGFLKRLYDEKADVSGEESCERMSQEGEATGGWDSGERLEYAQNGVGNSRMKRRFQVWEEEQATGRGKRRSSMIRKRRLQEKNVEVRRKRITTIDENEKYDEVEYEEEASRGGDFKGRKMLQESLRKQGNKEALRVSLGKGSRRRMLQEDASKEGNSRRWRLQV